MRKFLLVPGTIFRVFLYQMWNNFWPSMGGGGKDNIKVIGIIPSRSSVYSFHADRPHNKSLSQTTFFCSAKNDFMLQDPWQICSNHLSYINLWKRYRHETESSSPACSGFIGLNHGSSAVGLLDWDHSKCWTVPYWYWLLLELIIISMNRLSLEERSPKF